MIKPRYTLLFACITIGSAIFLTIHNINRSDIYSQDSPHTNTVPPNSLARTALKKSPKKNQKRAFIQRLDELIQNPSDITRDEWWNSIRPQLKTTAQTLSLKEVLTRIKLLETPEAEAISYLQRINQALYCRWGELDPHSAWKHGWQRAVDKITDDRSQCLSLLLIGWSKKNAAEAYEHWLSFWPVYWDRKINYIILQDDIFENWALQDPDTALRTIASSNRLGNEELTHFFRGLSKTGPMPSHMHYLDRYAFAKLGRKPHNLTETLETRPTFAFAKVWIHLEPDIALDWYASQTTPSTNTRTVRLNRSLKLIDRFWTWESERAITWLAKKNDEELIAKFAYQITVWRNNFIKLSHSVKNPQYQTMLADKLVSEWNSKSWQERTRVDTRSGWTHQEVKTYIQQANLTPAKKKDLITKLTPRARPLSRAAPTK